jgi:hypothetical protein
MVKLLRLIDARIAEQDLKESNSRAHAQLSGKLMIVGALLSRCEPPQDVKPAAPIRQRSVGALYLLSQPLQ